MKGGTVQINWHDTKPVLTLDFHSLSSTLATGGADFDIKIWSISPAEPQKKLPTATYINSLSYHSAAVNVLRFSPSGQQLASGADGGELIIWKMHIQENGQTWKVFKTLSFHRKDVLDLQWSNDGSFLMTGSVDNSCIIWDMNKGSVHQIIDAHSHYVQGVAWDPLSKYIASISSDRTCRIYVNKTQKKTKGAEKMNYVCQHVISKSEVQLEDDSKSAKIIFSMMRLWHHFSEDCRGRLMDPFYSCLLEDSLVNYLQKGLQALYMILLGCYKSSPVSETVNASYIFSRKDLSRPALVLPGASKPVVAVRFCHTAFTLRKSISAALFKLPYRLIFAVATLNSLYIYDTESVPPIAILAGLHYAPITDIAWSPDTRYLAVSSQDGYCTIVEFENEELGSPISLAGKSNTQEKNESTAAQAPKDTISESPADNVMADCKETKMLANTEEAKETKVMANGEENKVVIDPKDGTQRCPTKQPSPGQTSTNQNKAAKRRITPMAIDP